MADRFESLLSLVGDDFSVRWLITLLHFLWQGVVVGSVVVFVGRLLQTASARTRYALCSTALLSLPVCVAVTFCVVDVPANRQPLSFLGSQSDTSAMPIDLPAPTGVMSAVQTKRSDSTEASVDSGHATNNAAPLIVAGDSSETQANSSMTILSHAAPWIAVAYFLGVVFFLLRLSIALWGGYRLRTPTIPVTDSKLLKLIGVQAHRVKLKCVPVVAYCERIAVPTVVGVLRPMILLPVPLMTNLTPNDFAAIIRHELTHICRYDLWMNLLQRVIESLFFFHPVVWFVSRRLNVEREVCCDELVVSSGYEPMHYAGALLRMAELCAVSQQPGVLSMAVTGDKTPLLEKRIERLMNWRHTPPLQLTRAGMAVLLMSFVALIALPGIAHAWVRVQTPTAELESITPPQPARDEIRQDGLRTIKDPAFLLPDHRSVISVGFDSDNTEIVTASTQNFVTIRRWDVAGKKLKREVKLASEKHGRSFLHNSLIFSGDRSRVIAATDEYVGIWDTATGELLKTLLFPKELQNDYMARGLVCTPDLSVIACAMQLSMSMPQSADGYAVVWDVASEKVLQTVTHGGANYVLSIALSPDGKWIATSSRQAQIWETASGKPVLALPNVNYDRPYSDIIHCMQFSPSGKQIAIGDLRGVKLLDTRSGELLHQIEAKYNLGNSKMVFSKNGRMLARVGTGTTAGRTVPIWSTKTGERLFVLQTDSNDGAFSDDGKRFVVGLTDRKIGLAVWQLSGNGVNSQQGDRPVPESGTDKIAQNTHYTGPKAVAFIDKLNPVWSTAQLGIEYGVTLSKPKRQFRVGERVLLAAFFRNVSDKPLEVDVRPDYFWNIPTVINENGATVEIEKIALLGTIPHYRGKLEPGGAFGPFYLNFGLGENPRPGEQNWFPYYESPVPGEFKLMHSVSVGVRELHDGKPSSEWESGEFTSGMVEFEIAAASTPSNR